MSAITQVISQSYNTQQNQLQMEQNQTLAQANAANALNNSPQSTTVNSSGNSGGTNNQMAFQNALANLSMVNYRV